MIVISPEHTVIREAYWINQLLENDLGIYHIRKYHFDDIEMMGYIQAIDVQFRNKITLHSHHHLAQKLTIERLHFNETARVNNLYLGYAKDFILSTSVHSIKDFNTLDTCWDYAFLSPVFPGISKPDYGTSATVLEDIKHRTNHHVQLIGLGGISKDNLKKVLEYGADGIALSGSVWQSQNPLNSFLQCRQTDR